MTTQKTLRGVKLHIILYVILTVFLCSLASAIDTDDSRLKHWYKMNEAAASTTIDDTKVPGALMTEVGGPLYEQSCFTPNCIQGTDYAVFVDGNGGGSDSWVSDTDATINYTPTAERSFLIWFWINLTTSADRVLWGSPNGNNDKLEIYFGTTFPRFSTKVDGSNVAWTVDTTGITLGTAQSIAWGWNHTHQSWYIDGVLLDAQPSTADFETDEQGPMTLGDYAGGGVQGVAGFLDDMAIFSKTDGTDGDVFTNSEILDLHNNWLETPTPAIPPSFKSNTTNATSITPIKNDILKMTITVTDDIDVNNVTLATNLTGPMTNESSIIYDGTLTSVTALFNISIIRSETTFSYQYHSSDAAGNTNSSKIFTQKIFPSSKLDILFANKTQPTTYITSLDEGEDFYTYINWTSLNNPITAGTCNITLEGGLTETEATEQNFTLCGSGCDYSTYTEELDLVTIQEASEDHPHFNACHLQTAQGDITVNVSCGSLTNIQTISSAGLPLCPITSFIFLNTSVCIGSQNINLSLKFAGVNSKRKNITKLAADREYINHTTPTFYNTTLNLWRTNDTHEYYENGAKTIYGNCTHNTDVELNINKTETIIIVNIPPIINFNQLMYEGGIIALVDDIILFNYTGLWEWDTSVSNSDLSLVNYSFYDTSGVLLYSNQSAIPIIFETPEDLFDGFASENPYNFTIWANDTSGDRTQIDLNFSVNMVDLAAPTITVILPNLTDTNVFNGIIVLNWTTDENTNCTVNNTDFALVQATNTSYKYTEAIGESKFYSINITCTDGWDNIGYANLSFYKDINPPTISSSFPSEDNTSVFENTNPNMMKINFSVTDNVDLFVYNLSIKKKSNNQLMYNSSALISGTLFGFQDTINTASWDNTTFVETIRACDSHTDFNIPDFQVIKTKNKLTYQYSDTLIKIRAMDDSIAGSGTEKLIDRYSFRFDYSGSGITKTYKITSNKLIDYLPDSSYKGHFIVDRKYWVDFEQEGAVIVEKGDYNNESGGYEWFIYVEKAGDIVKFESLGFLNCVTEAYEFNLVSEITLYNIGLLAGNLFNNSIFSTNTTAGVLLFFFLLACLIALVIFGEHSRIPAIMILAGIFWFFFGILLYVTISAILGIIFTVMGGMYIIRSMIFTS